jgi:hypothetical protein
MDITRNSDLFSGRSFLIVADYSRQDFVSFFEGLPPSISLYFIDPLNAESVTPAPRFPPNSHCIYWKDFAHAQQLLQQLQISKVFVFFLEAYNHLALRAAAKVLGIPVVHLEHGYRSTQPLKRPAPAPPRFQLPVSDYSDRLRTQLFFFRTLLMLPGPLRRQLWRFYRLRRKSKEAVYQPGLLELLTPDAFISFSPAIFEVHRQRLQLDSVPVQFTGFPQFDAYLRLCPATRLQHNLLFIDQNLAEQGLLGWTPAHRQRLLDALLAHCRQAGVQLLVKPHPYSSPDFWQGVARLDARQEGVQLLDEAGLQNALAENYLVLGFYSTLLLPLAALPHTVVFCIEDHPQPEEHSPSAFLLEAGVAEGIGSINEMGEKLARSAAYQQQQAPHKAAFAKEWLYQTDGHSQKRYLAALLACS